MQQTRVGYIYKITHTSSGRIYIGQTCDKKGIKNRWSGHISASNRKSDQTYFHRAIRKYGKDSFTICMIEECSKDLLNEREIFYISRFKSNQKEYGFNMSSGGDGGQNTMSDEVRMKISLANKGKKRKPLTEETKLKISQANKGRVRTREERDKISKARNVISLTADWKKNISIGLKKSAKFSLSKMEADSIVDMLNDKSDKALSVEFNVSRATIWKIRKGLYPLAKNYILDDKHLYVI